MAAGRFLAHLVARDKNDTHVSFLRGHIMNSLSLHAPTVPFHIAEMRLDSRVEVTDLLVVLKWGTGQIIEISSGGLSFGCLYPHFLPDEWCMDILNAQGLHLKNIQVRKIWEQSLESTEVRSRFEVVTGVEFIDLSAEQRIEIRELTAKLEHCCLNRLLEELELSGFQRPGLF